MIHLPVLQVTVSLFPFWLLPGNPYFSPSLSLL